MEGGGIPQVRVSGPERTGDWSPVPTHRRTRACCPLRGNRMSVWGQLVLISLDSLPVLAACLENDLMWCYDHDGPLCSLFQMPVLRLTELPMEDKAGAHPARGTPVRTGRRHSSQTLHRLSVPPRAQWVLLSLQVWLVSMTT